MTRDRFDEIKRNAISANLLGTSSVIGITYERLLSARTSLEFGIGAIGLGAGVKFFPSKVKQSRGIFHTGLSATYHNSLGWGSVVDLYLPIGLSLFGEKGLNFGIDIGPALF